MCRNNEKRLAFRRTTLKALFAKSGNECAFQNCDQPLIDEKMRLIGTVCHIKGVKSGSKRFDPKLSAEAKRSYENLILLCHPHHVAIDSDEDDYSVKDLLKIKREHEAKVGQKKYRVDEKIILEITKESENFWKEVRQRNAIDDDLPKLSLNIYRKNSFEKLVNDCSESLNVIEDFVYILMHNEPDIERKYFEYVCLGLPNHVTHISAKLEQMHCIYLEKCIKADPSNKALKEKLNKQKKILLETAEGTYLND